MLIEKNKVVTFHYRMNEPGHDVIDDSRKGNPVVYLHGYQGMLQGLEDAMAGRQAGDQLTVTLSPEQAYGSRQEGSQRRISIKHVINDSKKKATYKPGDVVQLNTEHGARPAIVVKVGLKTLDIDTNHPLAGKTLTFAIEIVDVRAATAEEIAHRHVHGDGGHHH
jgi:FKBP-type peptidyl-prolyl cis-trans isomerase SlyD